VASRGRLVGGPRRGGRGSGGGQTTS
jgi:hypothetical protein